MSLLAGIDRRDVALTAVVVALGQVDAFAPGLYGTNVVGPRWVVSATYLVAALSVLVRRTRRDSRSPSASERSRCRR